MNHALVYIFQAIRFLADALNEVNLDVPPLQQPNGLSVTGVTERIGTLCLQVKFVFGHNVTVRFYARSLPKLRAESSATRMILQIREPRLRCRRQKCQSTILGL